MKSKTRSEYLPWLIGGVAFLTVLVVFALYAHAHLGGNRAQQLASKNRRLDLIGRMQLDLASASEAEKSAVLATTDAGSLMFANQARAATTELVQAQQELRALLAPNGPQSERELLAQFSTAFANLQRLDDELLALAVQNTNLKAYSLLYGPAAETLAEMDTALEQVVARYADGSEGKQVMAMAFRARIGVLRIQVLLSPHIAEENDAKMDQMEASMTREETEIRKHLDGLATMTKLAADIDVVAAGSRFLEYEAIKAKILPLSRENTNDRSLTLSLTQKRSAMILCLDVLNALKQAVLEEPIAEVSYGRAAKPR